MASKNVIQCKAIIIPAPKNLSFVFVDTCIFSLIILMYKNIKTPAISIRYQTKAVEPIEINSPRIAVKPAIKTRKCKWR